MKEVEIFIGPCSKYITGQGWTTEVPVEQLKAKGWVKSEEIERLTEERDMYADDLYWKAEVRKREDFITELMVENAELQKQVDKAWFEVGKMCMEERKDTAKEIYGQMLEWIPICEGYSDFIYDFESWLKERYGVEVE